MFQHCDRYGSWLLECDSNSCEHSCEPPRSQRPSSCTPKKRPKATVHVRELVSRRFDLMVHALNLLQPPKEATEYHWVNIWPAILCAQRRETSPLNVLFRFISAHIDPRHRPSSQGQALDGRDEEDHDLPLSRGHSNDVAVPGQWVLSWWSGWVSTCGKKRWCQKPKRKGCKGNRYVMSENTIVVKPSGSPSGTCVFVCAARCGPLLLKSTLLVRERFKPGICVLDFSALDG